MKATTSLGLLAELISDLSHIDEGDIVTPKTDRPEEACILGNASFELKKIYTLYARLTEKCDTSLAVLEEQKALDAITSLPPWKPLDDQLVINLELARANLSLHETMLDLVWALFLAEAARLFPSYAYLEHSVTVYNDWSVAIMPEELDEEDKSQDDEDNGLDQPEGRPTVLH